MAHCVSEFCRKPIDDRWAFCPYCGTDNRPPSQQEDVGEHRHQFLNKSGCCLLCGEPSDEPYFFNRKWRIRIGLTFLALGILAGLFIFNMHMVMAGKSGLFADWIRSWFDIQITRRRKYGHYYTVSLGHDVTVWLTLGGILTAGLGVIMLLRVPIEKLTGSRGYWDYQDDKPSRRGWWW